ncbi:hypothetical protein AC1031_004455 [Aphanomyces cochlioides]|nr:hypothetical protein AC1031_004455 [Aphanomyces cochlioides]
MDRRRSGPSAVLDIISPLALCMKTTSLLLLSTAVATTIAAELTNRTLQELPPALSYLASIESAGQTICTGVLFAPQWARGRYFHVDFATAHPLYNESTFGLAVLQLNQTSAHRPATLSFDELAPRTPAFVRSFGSLDATTPTFPTTLQEKNGTVLPFDECPLQ